MMTNTTRIHSTICSSFLQLLMMMSIAYPTPPPPLFHNMVLTRLLTSVYLGLFPTSRFYLGLDCTSIGLKLVSDGLYIRYIVSNYTFVFGLLDMICDGMFFTLVIMTLNGNENTVLHSLQSRILQYFKNDPQPEEHPTPQFTKDYNAERGHYVYTSMPPAQPPAMMIPITTEHTYSSNQEPTRRNIQPFKPNFYTSSTSAPTYGVQNITADNIYSDRTNSNSYINFESYDQGRNNYANLFVSPYFTQENSIDCKLELFIFIYSLFHFIYQIMIYINITNTCKTYNYEPNNSSVISPTILRLLC